MQIDWNATAGLITAIATLVLAVLTGVYVKLTSDSIKKSTESIQEQVRPYVFAAIILKENTGLRLHIANTGKRIAYDVKIEFSPDITVLESVTHHTQKYSVKDRLNHRSIAPGLTIESDLFEKVYFDNIIGFDESKKATIPSIFDIVVKYYDSQNQCYTEAYRVDILSLIKGKLYSKDPYLAKLDSITASASSIASDVSLIRNQYAQFALRMKDGEYEQEPEKSRSEDE